MTKHTDYEATWRDGRWYIVDVDGEARWYSHDGDWWTEMDGTPVQGTEFGPATILMHGGPRDGERVG
jgi:hypothetical protein